MNFSSTSTSTICLYIAHTITLREISLWKGLCYQLCLSAWFISAIEYWLKVIFYFALTVYGPVDKMF